MVETHIVKRHGHKETFDEKKAYGSIYWACRSSHMEEEEAEKVAEQVLKKVKKWIKDKKEIDSQAIFSLIGEELKKINKDASIMYIGHRDLS